MASIDRTLYKKWKAKHIKLDPEDYRWQWNVAKGGYAVFGVETLLDGRIKIQLGDGSDVIVQPNDVIWARLTLNGRWTDDTYAQTPPEWKNYVDEQYVKNL